jgi:hypothetical protein
MDVNKDIKDLQPLSAALKKLYAPKKSLGDHTLSDILVEATAGAKAARSDARPRGAQRG